MSLLSPSESMAFQSFLSSIDYPADSFHPTPTELLVYTHGVYSATDIKDPLHSKSKDALKKATLDLMSLDTPSLPHPSSSSPWLSFPNRDNHPSSSAAKHPFRYPMGTDITPSYKSQPERPVSLATDLAHRFAEHSSSSSPSPGPHIASPAPSYPSNSSSSRPSLPKLRSSTKRSFDNVSAAAPSPPSSSKRIRFSPSLSEHSVHAPSPSSTSSSTPVNTVPSSRPALLSASQKRANHIQSEQKRRANIRKGYEALCETVPALREAIRKEEEEAAAAGSSTTSNGSSSKGRRKKSKSTSDDDKMDGRAGPKSENIVLQKTIDYIHELNSSKDNLSRRLQQARHMLGPGHPTLYASQDIPQDGLQLWEREWSGGLGLAGDEDELGGSDDDA